MALGASGMALMLRVMLGRLNFAWSYGAVAVLLAWTIGAGCSDRWWWSQWLAWIPGPIVGLITSVALVWPQAVGRAGPRMLRRLLALGAVLAAGMSLRDDIGWSCVAAREDTISIAFLNARWPGRSASEFTPALAGIDADLFILGNCGRLGESSEADRWLPAGAVLYRVGPFAVGSQLGLVASRLVYAGELGTVAVIQTAPLSGWPDGIRVGIFDLPSDPLIERAQLAIRLRADLVTVGLGEVDVAVGDFNMTSGWSLRHLLPGLVPGSACGWQGTFPRRLPLWRLDHIVARSSLRLHNSTTFNPDTGAHRGVRACLSPVVD